MESRSPMIIELTHHPGRAVASLEGWIEGDPGDLTALFARNGSVALSGLDPRLEGNIITASGFKSGMARFELLVNGPVTVEGRPLNIGERVWIVTGGGAVNWYTADGTPL